MMLLKIVFSSSLIKHLSSSKLQLEILRNSTLFNNSKAVPLHRNAAFNIRDNFLVLKPVQTSLHKPWDGESPQLRNVLKKHFKLPRNTCGIPARMST